MMGHGSHMVIIIIIFFLMISSFYFLIAKQGGYLSINVYGAGSNTLTGTAAAAAHINIIPTTKVQNQYQKKGLILEKLRFLVGLIENGKSSRNNNNYTPDSSIYLYGPSPSPSPTPGKIAIGAPAVHAHPPLHHSVPRAHKNGQGQGQGQGLAYTRVVVTAVVVVVVSFVGVTCLVLCGIGLFLIRSRRRSRRQRTSSVVVFCRPAEDEAAAAGLGGSRGTTTTTISSVKKLISSDPAAVPHHLFYLDSHSLQQESSSSPDYLEQEKCCLKKLIKSSSSSSQNRQGSNKKKLMMINLNPDECETHEMSCSFGEISSVHELSADQPTKNSSEQAFDDESDDESFHSFCDSHSSSRSRPCRLSNASANSSSSEIIISISRDETQILQPAMPMPMPMPPINLLSQTAAARFPASSTVPPPPSCPSPLSRTHNLLINYSLKGKGKGKAPPPPPPPELNLNQQQVPLGKDGSPLPKLKPLHWDKLRAAPNRSTVWDNMRSSSFEFDEEMIESLFGYNLQNPIENDEAKSKTPSPSSKHVLEPKRLQNITILSKALNATAEQVCGALIRGDGLSLQDLEALSKMVPTKEEEAKLANYKGEILELGSAEKLVKAMLNIPFAFSRIEAMLYRETFQDELLHLRKSFLMLQEACMELRSSRLFLKLLEAVLKTGNRMNVGTIRGGAKAFKLDALLKLADVKGTDGRTTLLHFVVQEIIRSEGLRVSESIMGKIHQISKTVNVEDKDEHYTRMGLDLVSGLSTELCNAKKTATIDLDVLASSVANISDGMHKLQNLVQKDKIMEEKKGSFVTSIRSFLNYAETKLKELQEDENRVLSHVREITEYFHGDVSKDESNPLRIFVIVRDFLSMLDNVCKELRSSKAPRSTPNPLAPFR